MPKHRIIFSFAFSLLTLWALAADVRPVFSQNVAEIVADQGSFKESYDSAVPVSGSAIVGVRLGEADGNVVVRDTQLALHKAADVCVRVVTRDGRFSANNIYKLPTPLPDVNRVRLSPVTLNYVQALSSYKKDDLAVSAFPAQDGACLPSEVAFIPQLANPQRPWPYLTILINSGGRHCLLLVQNKQQKVRCQPISQGSRIAYDQRCQVPVDILSEGGNNFTLFMDDGFEEEALNFIVTLPPGFQ